VRPGSSTAQSAPRPGSARDAPELVACLSRLPSLAPISPRTTDLSVTACHARRPARNRPVSDGPTRLAFSSGGVTTLWKTRPFFMARLFDESMLAPVDLQFELLSPRRRAINRTRPSRP